MEKVYVAVELPAKAKAQIDELDVDAKFWNPPDLRTAITDVDLCNEASDATVLVSAVNVPVSAEYIKGAPNLKLIANIGDGYDNIDLALAKERGIAVTNAPTLDSIASTAEQTVTLALALSRAIIPGDDMMRQDDFIGWRVTGYLGGHQVYGKNFTIIGLGRVGKMVAQMLSGFNLSLNYVDPVPAPKDFEEKYDLTRISLDEALETSDYISLNCTLNDTTRLLIGADALNKMKSSAYLINCARGGIVDETALLDALITQQIAGAAIDTPQHAPHIDPQLAALPNVVVTPHGGNATYEARVEMSLDATGDVVRFVRGEPLLYRV